MKYDFNKIFNDFEEWFPRERHWIDDDEVEVIKDRLFLREMDEEDLKEIFKVVCIYENNIGAEEKWVEKLDKCSAVKAVINEVFKERTN